MSIPVVKINLQAPSRFVRVSLEVTPKGGGNRQKQKETGRKQKGIERNREEAERKKKKQKGIEEKERKEKREIKIRETRK